MNNQIEIRIYPRFDAFYYSFYLLGLFRHFGKYHKSSFTLQDFPPFPSNIFAISTSDNKRVIIDANDTPSINSFGAEWCSIYGKINYYNEIIPERFKSKIVPIGPSFAVRLWSLLPTFYYALQNTITSRNIFDRNRDFYANYFRQYAYRQKESNYQRSKSSDNYIFSLSSLWKKESETNKLRALFINSCKSLPNINFEGGFAPRHHNDILGFENLTISKRYKIDEYLEKTKHSFVVFNTPAVLGCLGWKLGEFLALGKAIISTPLKREMPAPLIHGKDIHFVDGTGGSMLKAITLIHENRNYKEELELNARKYYENYLSPEKVIEKLFT